jgi:hypothetical protein
MYKSDRDCEKEAKDLNAAPPVKFVGVMGGHPMFQQDPPGVGSFMLWPDETTVAQAYERARARFEDTAQGKKTDAVAEMFAEAEDLRRHEMQERINAILQDGGEDMAPCDVLDCVFGTVSFTMNDADREYVLKEVRAITGRS